MYVPHFNALDDADEIRALVTAVGSAQLVTVGEDGYPLATLLPVIWDDDRLVFHFARANPHWRSIEPGSPGLAVVTGPEAYVSPAWYAVEGRARSRRPDLELLRGAVPRAGHGARRRRLAARGSHPAHRPARERARRAVGGVRRARRRTSRSSCGPSSAWSWRSSRWRRRPSSARTAPSRTERAWWTDCAPRAVAARAVWRTPWNGFADPSLGSAHEADRSGAASGARLVAVGDDAEGPSAVRPRLPPAPGGQRGGGGHRRRGARLPAEHPGRPHAVQPGRAPAGRGVDRGRLRLGAVAPRPDRSARRARPDGAAAGASADPARSRAVAASSSSAPSWSARSRGSTSR